MESLEVNIEGEILTDERRLSVPSSLKMKKRQNREKEKLIEAARKKTISEENERLFSTSPVFEKNEEEYANNSCDEISEYVFTHSFIR